MNIDQITADAVNEIEKCFPSGTRPFVGLERMALQAIIKSAIEKATENAVRETSDYIMAKLRQEPRAAHASGEGTTQERYNELARKTPRESKSPTGAAHASEQP